MEVSHCFVDRADKMMNIFSLNMTEILHDYRVQGHNMLKVLCNSSNLTKLFN